MSQDAEADDLIHDLFLISMGGMVPPKREHRLPFTIRLRNRLRVNAYISRWLDR